MEYSKIGVFGATGLLGQEVTRALKDEGFEVVPFSRRSTTVAGIPTQIVGSLVGFDAIVSTVGPEGWNDQIPLIAQAKADGVKRFITSEFGMDHRGSVVNEYLLPKEHALKAAQEAGFVDGWTAFINGFFETVAAVIAKYDPNAGKIVVTGKGETRYPFVFRYDIGRAISRTLKAPSSDYKDSWVVIPAHWTSGNELAELIQRITGRNLPVEHVKPTEKTPVILFLENTGGNVFDRSLEAKDLGLEQRDFTEYVRSWFTAPRN